MRVYACALAALAVLWASGHTGQLCLDGFLASEHADLTPPSSPVALVSLPPPEASSPELAAKRPQEYSGGLARFIAFVILPVLSWPPLPREPLPCSSFVANLRAHARTHASAASATRPRRRKLGQHHPRLFKASPTSPLFTSAPPSLPEPRLAIPVSPRISL